MSLPSGGSNVPWPPVEWRTPLAILAEWAAWYSGDPQQLADVYGGAQVTHNRAVVPWWKFWRRTAQMSTAVQARAQLHVPLAGDIAATSAGLLFSEAPRISIVEAHGEKASSEAKATEAYTARLIEEGGLVERLVEGADAAAGIGGVLLHPSWDMDVAPMPVLAITQADQALPEFRFGILTAVTLWRTIKEDGRKFIRHLERHEVDPVTGKGIVEHGLYEGARMILGERLDDARLLRETGLEPRVEMPFPGLGVRYVPNMRPNRRMRGRAIGASDYSESEGLLDALDEVYASWVRDIRLAKARIMVPEQFLDSVGRFDVDNEVFSPLGVPIPSAGDKGLDAMMSINQFEIRVDEHERTALHYVERIVSRAGYSPQTFGLKIEGRAESGTALHIRENKTFLTQQRKAQWWAPAIADCVMMLQAIAADVFNENIEPMRPNVELADSIAENPREIAETVELLSRAGALSRETKVRMSHPDWDEDQVRQETQRILDEEGMVVPAPPPEFPGEDDEPPAFEGDGEAA